MAGIGRLVLAHGGFVEAFHMNRMILASYDSIGRRSPAAPAAERIAALNPSVEVEVVEENVTDQTVDAMVGSVDVVLDCPPTFEERHLLNQACVRLGKPMIEAAMYGMEGYVTTIVPGRTPCLSCLGLHSQEWGLPFPVLGAIPCTLGSLAALEAIKVLTGYGSPLLNTILLFDGFTSRTRYISAERDPDCPVCSSVPANTGGPGPEL
jgi:molybdopterin/thiamine biosynthesis adenylyltransferase